MPQKRQTVYIIDDDDSVRRALRRLIRSVGWNAETFATAQEFLRYPAQSKPSCLILDVQLPGLSGLELQQQLQVDCRTFAVVFITAYEETHVREQALGAGAIAFLQKPFEEQALLEAVNRAMDR
jgi:FixJ family two-component response regulator